MIATFVLVSIVGAAPAAITCRETAASRVADGVTGAGLGSAMVFFGVLGLAGSAAIKAQSRDDSIGTAALISVGVSFVITLLGGLALSNGRAAISDGLLIECRPARATTGRAPNRKTD